MRNRHSMTIVEVMERLDKLDSQIDDLQSGYTQVIGTEEIEMTQTIQSELLRCIAQKEYYTTYLRYLQGGRCSNS